MFPNWSGEFTHYSLFCVNNISARSVMVGSMRGQEVIKINSKNLKQNEAQSARAESTHKGVNWRSKDVTQVQQRRPESPTVTLTWL